MTRRSLFLLLTIYMLNMFVGAAVCNASEINKNIDAQLLNQNFNPDEDDQEAHIVNSYSDSYHPKCILSESTTEEDQADISFIKLSPIRSNTFYDRSNDLIERSNLKIYGLLERNLPPVKNVSRTILFHRFQINF